MRSATCFPICFALAAASLLVPGASLHALAAAGAFFCFWRENNETLGKNRGQDF